MTGYKDKVKSKTQSKDQGWQNEKQQVRRKSEAQSKKRGKGGNKQCIRIIYDRDRRTLHTKPSQGLGRKLLGILKTSPENQKKTWGSYKSPKPFKTSETYASCEKDLKIKKGKSNKQKKNETKKPRRQNTTKEKTPNHFKGNRVKNSKKFLRKIDKKNSEGKERVKNYSSKNEYNSLKKEARQGKMVGQKRSPGTLDFRSYTNKENRRVPISCQNKNIPRKSGKSGNQTLLGLFLQKKCDNLEDLLKQKMNKSRKDKMGGLFRKDSTKDNTEINGLAKLFEKSKPILSHFHTTKEKSSMQDPHESLLGIKPRTRMAKMFPNYINSIDNNINSLQNIHHRRKEDLSSQSRILRLEGSKGFGESKTNVRGADVKKIWLESRLERVRDLNNFLKEKPSKPENFSKLGNYSNLKRKPKSRKNSENKSPRMAIQKHPDNFQKLFTNKTHLNEKRLRLRSIHEIDSYKHSRSIKHSTQQNLSKRKKNDYLFKKKISLPDKHRKKETYKLFKSKWAAKNQIEDSFKESSVIRFDLHVPKKNRFADKISKKRAQQGFK